MNYDNIRQHKIGACQRKTALRESDRYKIFTDIRSATEAVNLEAEGNVILEDLELYDNST